MLSTLAGALLLSGVQAAAGAPANAHMMVSVTVTSRCTVSAGPGAVSARTRLAVLCSSGAPFVVTLGDGTQRPATVSGTGHGLMPGAAITAAVSGQPAAAHAETSLAPALSADTVTLTIAY